MKIKVFGKDLFEARTSKADSLLCQISSSQKESKYLPDFLTAHNDNSLSNWVTIQNSVTGAMIAGPAADTKKEAPKPVEKKTPKDVYDLKMLHDKSFKLNMDPKYIDETLASFKDKLNLIKTEEYDMRRGVDEISSIIIRMENRKKYSEVKEVFEQYPYTTQSRVDDVIKENDYLKIGQVAQFLADMPAEAVEAMKKYNKGCEKLCGKQAVFYIIADKKDFEKTVKRRDPILLAQSPFGHFWQILGAWDKEMILLEDL